ncbi:uncharacterized protein J3D65DRAFT_318146 [Phyllosticta citribraziliensis]|uniref:Uncharacterized protein n=1 Tax=Phyllosticta citribraziliensis TaxID=989973 RepID=A0ABR1LTY9_9PEZI
MLMLAKSKAASVAEKKQSTEKSHVGQTDTRVYLPIAGRRKKFGRLFHVPIKHRTGYEDSSCGHVPKRKLACTHLGQTSCVQQRHRHLPVGDCLVLLTLLHRWRRRLRTGPRQPRGDWNAQGRSRLRMGTVGNAWTDCPIPPRQSLFANNAKGSLSRWGVWGHPGNKHEVREGGRKPFRGIDSASRVRGGERDGLRVRRIGSALVRERASERSGRVGASSYSIIDVDGRGSKVVLLLLF